MNNKGMIYWNIPKHIIVCLLLSFIPFLNYAQNADTTTNKNNLQKGIFLSAGVGLIQYHNSNFFSYLFDKIGASAPAVLGNGHDYTVTAGSTSPNQYNYKNSLTVPGISGGIELTPVMSKWAHHFFELSYMNFSGEYSYNVSYRETSYPPGSPGGAWANINDTVSVPYTQNVLCAGYKFQFNYKFLIFSMGARSDFNFIKVNEQKREEQDYWDISEFTGKTVYDGTFDSIKTTNHSVFYVNLTLQMSIGTSIKYRRFEFNPALYFTDYFGKGYYSYHLALDIEYKIH